MDYAYTMRTDVIYDEDGKAFTVYGIEAISNSGEVLFSFPDIFFDIEKGKDFVKMCNDLEISLIHMPDVVDDALV